MRRVQQAEHNESLRRIPQRQPHNNSFSLMASRCRSYCRIILLAVGAAKVIFSLHFAAQAYISAPQVSPEETFHNFIFKASLDLSAVSALVEMVNGLEQFRKLEVESVTRPLQTCLIIDILRFCSLRNIRSTIGRQRYFNPLRET
jgi:hypothetical protein